MTEQVSGKLPVERPEPMPQPIVIAHLAANAAQAYAQVTEAAEVFAEFATKLAAIAASLGDGLEKQIQEISNGAERDDHDAAG